ncbi:MAG: hypothetical protein K0S74_586 [Chlamydiales bacterium]|jgi:hypothetical protein|nr:hypothetical protein [Chlamydiales bacterium]
MEHLRLGNDQSNASTPQSTEKKEVFPISKLPKELIIETFSNFSAKELKQGISLVSKQWKKLADDACKNPEVWKNSFKELLPPSLDKEKILNDAENKAKEAKKEVDWSKLTIAASIAQKKLPFRYTDTSKVRNSTEENATISQPKQKPAKSIYDKPLVSKKDVEDQLNYATSDEQRSTIHNHSYSNPEIKAELDSLREVWGYYKQLNEIEGDLLDTANSSALNQLFQYYNSTQKGFLDSKDYN